MTREERLELLMERVMKRPIPRNPMGRVKLLARETAEGALEEIWGVRDFINDIRYRNYRQKRWGDNFPSEQLLIQNGYFSEPAGGYITIQQVSFDLTEEVEPAHVFISYRRKESSAFALLVLARLKEADLNAFLDMSLRPGDNWHAYIKEQIQQRDFFVLLLGEETLNSPVVQDEIRWAIEAGAEIIPIWHNGFEYKEGEFDLPPEIQRVLHSNHSIRVLEESALAYNNAVVELLNRFGVTP